MYLDCLEKIAESVCVSVCWWICLLVSLSVLSLCVHVHGCLPKLPCQFWINLSKLAIEIPSGVYFIYFERKMVNYVLKVVYLLWWFWGRHFNDNLELQTSDIL